MENFFITLPSTASSHIYPNTQSHFRVQLPQPIELEGQWRIGLSEIHVSQQWSNIDEHTDSFYLHLNENVKSFQIPKFSFTGRREVNMAKLLQHVTESLSEDVRSALASNSQGVNGEPQFVISVNPSYRVEFTEELLKLLSMTYTNSQFISQPIPPNRDIIHMSHDGTNLRVKVTYPKSVKTTHHKLNIPHGLYTKTDDVLQAMMDVIPKGMKQGVHFKNNRDGTISINCKSNIQFEFPSSHHGLGSLLGFTDNKAALPASATGDYTVDLKRGVYGLYVYSDLVQPHVVGDTFAPLLRVIPISESDKSSASYVKIYANPDYYPLMQNRFETIEIDIRSDFGQRLKFRNGKTLVKLSFQKV